MSIGSRSRIRLAPVIALSCLAAALPFAWPAPAGAVTPAPPSLMGAVLGASESSTFDILRDVGTSVALGNGKALWIFGDTSTYRYESGAWRPKVAIAGSTATVGSYRRGQRPTAMYEVNVGTSVASTNTVARFVPAPTKVYMPDGSGRLCTRANGALENGRWPTGATLLPDLRNILVSYAITCVPSLGRFVVEGWGFMEYNWTTNQISSPPTDVFPAASSGAALAGSLIFASPILYQNEVTFFSGTCCSPGYVFRTPVAANLAALSNPSSYVRHAIAGLPAAISSTVSMESYSPLKLQLFQLTDLHGKFAVFKASSAAGPWTREATGTLPGCANSPNGPVPCSSAFGHAELSTSAQLLVSYYLPGFGPGRAGHPSSALSHVVMAAITVGTPLPPLRPTGVRAVSRSTTTSTGALTVGFKAGLNGGATITKYNATCKSSNGGVTKYGVHYGATASPITVNGVTTAKSYACTVRASNAVGLGEISAPSKPVIVGTPSAPTGVKAVRVSTGRLRVTFNASVANGARITSYAATCTSSNGGTTRANAGASSPVYVGSLTAGKRYNCTVRAKNSRGFGLASSASPGVVA